MGASIEDRAVTGRLILGDDERLPQYIGQARAEYSSDNEISVHVIQRPTTEPDEDKTVASFYTDTESARVLAVQLLNIVALDRSE